MSSTAWAVELATRPSRFRQGLTLLLHGLALLALLQAGGLPGTLRLGVAGLVLLSVMLDLRAERRRGEYLREAGEEWWLECQARRGMVRLVRARTWRWLVVVEFAGDWQERPRRERLVIWPDAVAPDDFRRLRVRLRCGALPGRPEKVPRKAPKRSAAAAATATAASVSDGRS